MTRRVKHLVQLLDRAIASQGKWGASDTLTVLIACRDYITEKFA